MTWSQPYTNQSTVYLSILSVNQHTEGAYVCHYTNPQEKLDARIGHLLLRDSTGKDPIAISLRHVNKREGIMKITVEALLYDRLSNNVFCHLNGNYLMGNFSITKDGILQYSGRAEKNSEPSNRLITPRSTCIDDNPANMISLGQNLSTKMPPFICWGYDNLYIRKISQLLYINVHVSGSIRIECADQNNNRASSIQLSSL